MESILYVGMDVHTSNYTLCTYSIETDKEFGLVKFEPDYLIYDICEVLPIVGTLVK